MSAVLSEIGDYAIFESESYYSNILSINGIIDNITPSSGYTIEKKIAWSYDKDTWSEYLIINSETLESIRLNYDKIYFKYKYTLTDNDTDDPITINNIEIDYIINENAIKPKINTKPTRINNNNKLIFNKIPSFNPYNINNSIDFYRGISNMVNNVYGHNSFYAKGESDIKFGRDFILNEDAIINMSEFKCVKVIIPNNDIPNGQMMYSILGITGNEITFDIHIDKLYFQNIFGKNSKPQSKDIIYIPMLNRMYSVINSYLHKSIMGIGLYYVVALQKYDISSSTNFSDSMQAKIDEMTNQTDNIFKDITKEEIDKITNKEQLSRPAVKTEYMRKYLGENLSIIEEDIKNYYNLISHFRYDLTKNLLTSELNTINIEYDKEIKYNYNSNRTYSCWFKHKDVSSPIRIVNLLSIDGNTKTGNLKITSQIDTWHVGDYLQFELSSSPNFFHVAKISNVISNTEYTLQFDAFIYDDVLNDNPAWNQFSNLKVRKTWNKVFLADNLDKRTFSIISYINKYYCLTIGDFEYWTKFNTNKTSWNCLIVSRSYEFKQIQFNIYKPRTVEDLTYNMIKEFSIILPMEDNDFNDIDSTLNYSLYGSTMEITAIRLLDTVVESDEHEKLLNQSIVKDGHLIIIADNAVPQDKSIYIGNPVK